jgi:hypothetical protein
MRRLLGVGLLAVMVLAVPASAQDDQQTLDTVRAALDQFLALATYSASVEQISEQNMFMSAAGKVQRTTQQRHAQGELIVEKTPADHLANRHLTVSRDITTTNGAAGQTQPYQDAFEVIVADDHVYVNLDVPPELRDMVPAGWTDITGGAPGFPGLEVVFDAESQLNWGTVIAPEDLDASSVRHVEIPPAITVEGRTVNRYRLTLDPSLAQEALSRRALAGMFLPGMAFDVPGYLDLIGTDPNSVFTVDVAVFADDGSLYEYTAHLTSDITLPADLITTPLPTSNAEIRITQDFMRTLRPTDLNMPVSITAPEVP